MSTIREQWIAALRSGRYRQGKGQLRTVDNKFCCLGVLCDIIDSEGWMLPTITGGRYIYIYRNNKSNSVLEQDRYYPPTSLLPQKISEELGELNDNENYDFAKIADYIEEHPYIDVTLEINQAVEVKKTL